MRPGKFTGNLNLTWMSPQWWRLYQEEDAPFSYTDSRGKITVRPPHKMWTDLGSIPRVLWWVCTPTEFAPAFVIHDTNYFQGLLTQKAADSLLAEGMFTLSSGQARLKRLLIYLGVRLFGSWAYQSYRRKDA